MPESNQIKSVNVPLTSEQLEAIGLVCHQWSMAESILEHFIWVLVPVNQETGRSITTHINDLSRIEIIKTLASSQVSDEMREYISTICTEFDELRIQRNEIVHNSWAGEKAEDLAVGHKFRAKGELKPNTNFWSETDIRALADDIEAWTVSTINFIAENIGWPSGK